MVGEALVDLIPDSNGIPQVLVGGGAANTAIALSKLEVPTSFVGGISQDKFGALISFELKSHKVDLGFARVSELPTATATVSLDSIGNANYQFSINNTATFDFSREWLPQDNPKVLHIGSLATVIKPGAEQLMDWLRDKSTIVVFDPNVRPAVLSDLEGYRKTFESWSRLSTVVKLSEDDLHLLYDVNKNPADLLDLGPKLIVLTRGNKGISSYFGSKVVEVPAMPIQVVDTVGAGDTVGAVIVESLWKFELNEVLVNMQFTLKRAARAAAITCSRAGAKPPKLSELNKN